jgi:uncharacterized protein YecA (UPF0149 family)
MPIREYKRLWCKKCNDWELFEQQYPNWKDWFCQKCETVHEKTLLSEIPNEKLIEQRKRYIEYNHTSIGKFMGEMMMSSQERNLREFVHMMSPPGSDFETEIIESDAGQIQIDEELRKRREEKRQKEFEEKEEIKKGLIKFKGANRNDTCPCGSGKKYKKCCLNKVEEQLLKYNLRF